MRVDAIEIVGPEGATFAPFLPIRGEHEVIDGQLMPAVEQLRQGLSAIGSFENIILVHPLPRQIPALLTKPVAQSREFLFVGEQLPPGGEPILVRNNFMTLHDRLQDHWYLYWGCQSP